MNILVLTPWYPTREHISNGVFVREFAKSVQKYCNVTVLHCGISDQTISHWWALAEEHDASLTDGIPTYRVLFRKSPIKGCSYLRSIFSVYLATKELSKEQGRPDVIHAHVYSSGWAALLVGRMSGIPVIITEHFSGFARGLLSRRQIYEARIIFRMADAVLPVSLALQKTLQEKGVKAKFQVVPNVINTNLFYYLPSQSPQNSMLRLLAVSSLVRNKGLEYLFQALKMVEWMGRPWHLDIAGDGPEAEQHRQVVRDLGLLENVTFHGTVAKEEVAKMMRAADIFVLPSLIETFSVATAEALASGLPVLVTRCGGPETFVTERTGMVVAPGSAKELADALTKMIEILPSYDRTSIANNAKRKFGQESIGATLYDLYSRLVREKSLSRL